MLGFFPDIYRILSKYALTPHLIEYIENGTFLSKYAWKKLVRDKINETSRRELLPLNHYVELQEYTLSCTSLIYCGLSVKNFHDIGDKYRWPFG